MPVCFDFLGYTFRPRRCERENGGKFRGVRPAISRKSEKRINDVLRKLAFHNLNSISIQELALKLQPRIRGWLKRVYKFNPELFAHWKFAFGV